MSFLIAYQPVHPPYSGVGVDNIYQPDPIASGVAHPASGAEDVDLHSLLPKRTKVLVQGELHTITLNVN